MRGIVDGLVNPNPLITSLPAIYQGESFLERFLSVFDDHLAPILTTLDTQDAYLDPALTPPDFLPWLAGWVGLELDENWSEEQQRRLIAGAVALMQWRGTHKGIVDLICQFLDVPEEAVEIAESGGAAWSVTPGGAPPGSSQPELHVTIRVERPDEVDTARVERLVAAAKPVHVPHRVEVVSA